MLLAKEVNLSMGDDLPQADLVQSLANFLLYLIDCVLELFGNGLASQRVNVKVVCFAGKDKERNDSDIAVGRLYGII